MKRYQVQIKINPNDEFTPCKTFSKLGRAKQSAVKIRQNYRNLINLGYGQVRVYDKISKSVISELVN